MNCFFRNSLYFGLSAWGTMDPEGNADSHPVADSDPDSVTGGVVRT